MKNTTNSLNRKATELNAVALIWLDERRVSEHWNLTLDQISILLGGISTNTYILWLEKANKVKAVQLKLDVVQRLSLLLGIHKAIILSSPKNHETDFWNSSINHPLFMGRSAKESLLLDPSLTNFTAIKKYFENSVV